MYPEAYNEWVEIFNVDLFEIWQKERQELKKASVLLSALQKELKNVQTNVESELLSIQQQIEYRDLLRDKKCVPVESKQSRSSSFSDKENTSKSRTTSIENKRCESESPDIFKNIDLNVQNSTPEITILDLSISDDDVTKIDGSPTIKRRRKRYNRTKTISPTFSYKVNSHSKSFTNVPTNKIMIEDSVKQTLFKTPARKSDNDQSVIENTPEIASKKSKTGIKAAVFKSKKEHKSKRNTNTTLTQLFRKSNMRSSEEGKNDIDSDETFVEDDVESGLEISDLIDYINSNETKTSAELTLIGNQKFLDWDTSTQEIDEFSKGAIFNENDLTTFCQKKKEPLPEPVVRGKARKQLHGWACEKCKNFYGQMKLSPEELAKKMDQCSRHRYKYQPPEDTLPGFWDLSIPPEN